MDKIKVISHILLLFDVKHMLFFSERSAKQFRQIGQNCKDKHEERSRSVSFTPFFFPLLSFADIILFGKSLTWIFCDGNSEPKTTPPGLSEGSAAFYCFTAPKSTSKRE